MHYSIICNGKRLTKLGGVLINYSHTVENCKVVKKTALCALIWKDLQDILFSEKKKSKV